jgi:hypothetical protein
VLYGVGDGVGWKSVGYVGRCWCGVAGVCCVGGRWCGVDGCVLVRRVLGWCGLCDWMWGGVWLCGWVLTWGGQVCAVWADLDLGWKDVCSVGGSWYGVERCVVWVGVSVGLKSVVSVGGCWWEVEECALCG